MKAIPLLEEPLKMLNIAFVNPLKSNLFNKIGSVTVFVLYVHLFIEFIPQFVVNWRGWDTLDEFTVWISIYQVMLKAHVMMNKNTKFRFILAIHLELYWSYSDMDKEFRQKIQSTHDTVVTLVKRFRIGIFATLIMYSLRPLITSERILPYDTYHPTDRSNLSYYLAMYVYQIFVSGMGAFCVLGFDTLFLSLIAHVICEIRIIKQRFLTLGINPNLDEEVELAVKYENRALIEHHNLVLKCIKQMEDIYSSALLNQFGVSIFSICLGLLSINATGFPPDFQHFSKYTTFLMSIFLQLLIYCSAGALLTTECESLSKSVYSSNWWIKTQPKLRKSYVLIIQRANRSDRLTTGGMFTLNLENFTRIVKTSYSFFALVHAAFEKK